MTAAGFSPLTALHSSKSIEHYTPPRYIAAARLVMGSIELDPASCEAANRTVQAIRFYTAGDDGLTQPWHAATVWCNPPYGRDPKRNHQAFIRRMLASYTAGQVEQAMLLVNSSTGERWFKPLWSYWICFLYERIEFVDECCSPQKSPTHSNVIVYFGPHTQRFADIFRAFGRIVPSDDQALSTQHSIWDRGVA